MTPTTTNRKAAVMNHTETTKKAQAWRKTHGRADGQDKDLIKAVREAGFTAEDISNHDIIEAIGYVDTGNGAIKKVKLWLKDNETEAATEGDTTAA
jgi:hypothetical protein